MFITTLIVLTSLLPRIDGGLTALRASLAGAVSSVSAPGPAASAPRFLPEARAVSNWREEAGGALRPASLALVVRYAAADPAFVARCVRLNNYWCIKAARWEGEIGADAEGHTGFATAADGADAAAQLLRRYYRAFGRRTALSIVRRWAPAECRLSGIGGAANGAAKVSTALAPRGIGNTVRARFLARHARGGAPRRALAARGGPLRIQPWSPLARLTGHRSVPKPTARIKTNPIGDIARAEPTPRPNPATASNPLAKPSTLLMRSVPGPERVIATSDSSLLAERFVLESAALPSIAAGLPGVPLLDLRPPAPFCGTDGARLRNYAARIAASVGVKLDDDLALFTPDGRPLPNLAPVMLAMSGVELGTLRAGPALVAAAIGRLSASALSSADAEKP